MDPDIDGLDDQLLLGLSTELGAEWGLFGICLGFRQAQIDQLREAFPRNVSRCISQLLVKWRDRSRAIGNTCLIPSLATALSEAGRTDLADSIRSRLNPSTEGVDDIDGSTRVHMPRCQQKPNLQDIDFGDVAVPAEYENLKSQTKLILNQTKKNTEVIVLTESWRTIMADFQTRRCVTICGNAGSGKTSLARYILLTLSDKGYNVIAISSPELIETLFNPDNGNMVFFCDDAFGVPEVSGLLTETWLRLHDKIRSFLQTDGFQLILTTRKQVLNSCRLTFENCEGYIGNIQDLDNYKLTPIEKEAMFMKHCANKNMCGTAGSIKDEVRESDLSCFPLLCKLYSADHSLHGMVDFFIKPLSVLVKHLHELRKSKPQSFCGLILILFHDGVMPMCVFDVFDNTAGRLKKEQIEDIKEACGLNRAEPLRKVHDGLLELRGVYVEENGENFSFIHDAILEAVSFVFGKEFPNQIVNICSPNFLHRRVRCSGMKDKYELPDRLCCDSKCSKNFTDVIFVHKLNDPLLAKRFVRDMNDGYIFEVCDNPSLQDERITQLIGHEVAQLSEREKEILFKSKDKITNRPLAHCIADMCLVFLAKCLSKAGLVFDCECLLRSCTKGHLGMVEFYVKAGVDLNQVSRVCGRAAVHLAAAMEDGKLLAYLIQQGADIHVKGPDGVSALTMAARKGNVKCMELLIRHGADINIVDRCHKLQPIHYAANCDNGLHCVKMLEEAGADLTSRNDDGYMPIHYAAECRCRDTLQYLLEKGGDPNSENNKKKRPLHYAGTLGEAENIRLLLEHGAKIDAVNTKGRQALHEYCACSSAIFCKQTMHLLIKDNINAKDHNGMTPLHITCWQMIDTGFLKAQELVELGADFAATDRLGRQPLMYALIGHSRRLAEMLLSKGAPLKCKDYCGRTPLHFACYYGNLIGVKQLLNVGVEIDAEDDSTCTPLAYAKFRGHSDIAQLLIDSGADENKVRVAANFIQPGSFSFSQSFSSLSLSLSTA